MTKLDPNGMCDVKSGSLFWQLVHDGIAHPLLVLGFYSRPVIRFHDYTSFKAWPLGVSGTSRIERAQDALQGHAEHRNVYTLTHAVPAHLVLREGETAGEIRGRGLPLPDHVPDCAVWKGLHFEHLSVRIELNP